MPNPRVSLSVHEAREFLRERCVIPTPSTRIGLEVEWLTRARDRQPSIEEMSHIVGDLPLGGRLSFEPGGQLEISSRPGNLHEVIASTRTDATLVRSRLLEAGVSTVGLGLETRNEVTRILHAPRYDAMETYFDAAGDAGRTMMCRTAAIQVNLDAGQDPLGRWELLTALAPVLAASFANSRTTTHRSGRLSNWLRLDPTRTAPVALGPDPRDSWASYTLQANVMMVRRSSEHFVVPSEPLTFERWIQQGTSDGYPDLDDLEYHLTTLFPPVRPRGWFEIRMFDAMPDPFWVVPGAIVWALVSLDPQQLQAPPVGHMRAPPVGHMWDQAAKHGLGHPVLANAAVALFEAAMPALDDLDDETRAACVGYFERYVSQGRTPADDPPGVGHGLEAA